VSKAVVVEWNGQNVPEELRALPAGRYVVAAVEESDALTDEEEGGLIAAMKSAESRVLSHDDVMSRAKKIVGG
jgi:hypothetical protein